MGVVEELRAEQDHVDRGVRAPGRAAFERVVFGGGGDRAWAGRRVGGPGKP